MALDEALERLARKHGGEYREASAKGGGGTSPRQRFIKAINHQIALADDENYTYEVGNKRIRPTPWFPLNKKADDMVEVQPRYGNAKMRNAKCAAIPRENLAGFLKELRDMADQGEFDADLEKAKEAQKRKEKR